VNMATRIQYYAQSAEEAKGRAFSVLFLIVFLLTSLAWTGQVWGQTQLARVGILSFVSISDDAAPETWFLPFLRTLSDQGWVERKNVSFEYRSAHSDPARFAEAAKALVDLNVDVILAVGAPAVRAAHATTRTIPIVAADYTADPIANNYVESYARPGGNVTGIFLDAPSIAGKWFELLQAMVPDLSHVAVLWDPSPGSNHLLAIRSVAKSLSILVQVVEVRKPDDLSPAFDGLSKQTQAVIILPSPMHYSYSAQLAGLALKHRLPATSMARAFAMTGGALAYGPTEPATYERSAVLVAKILGGAKAANIPLERPTKLELVVNLDTAKTLGITVPQSILLRADGVIK